MNIKHNENNQELLSLEESYAQHFEQLNPQKSYFLNKEDLNTWKMGISRCGLDILWKLMSYAREQKTRCQRYIAKVLRTSLTTVNTQIVRMERLGYITSFFNKKTDSMLSYKINYDQILKFLNEGFFKQYRNIYLNLTQWSSRNLKHINTILSSYLNNQKSTKSKIDAKVEEIPKKVEKVLLNSEEKKKINQRRQELKEKAKIKPKPSLKEKIKDYVTKAKDIPKKTYKKKIKPVIDRAKNKADATAEELISLRDKFLASMQKQNENRDQNEIEIYNKYDQKIKVDRSPKREISKNLEYRDRKTVQKLVYLYGADEFQALTALNNAKMNKNIKFPHAQVVSSQKAFEANLGQGLKYQELKRENEKIRNREYYQSSGRTKQIGEFLSCIV